MSLTSAAKAFAILHRIAAVNRCATHKHSSHRFRSRSGTVGYKVQATCDSAQVHRLMMNCTRFHP